MIQELSFPTNFCLQCLGCCRFSAAESIWQPAFLEQEINELSNAEIPPALISSDKKVRLLPQANNFICTFLNTPDNKCKIYLQRPFECRLYPFLINRQDNAIFLAIDLKCPFAQENLATALLKEYTQYLVTLLHSSHGQALLRNNPQIIHCYPEVLSLARLEI